MKIGIVGNQKGWNYEFIRDKVKIYISRLNESPIIISGGAEGVDTYAQMLSKELGLTIIIHYPDPNKPSPQRYFDRNKQIALESDVLFAFDKKSGRAGTKNTVAEAKKANKIIYEWKEGDE